MLPLCECRWVTYLLHIYIYTCREPLPTQKRILLGLCFRWLLHVNPKLTLNCHHFLFYYYFQKWHAAQPGKNMWCPICASWSLSVNMFSWCKNFFFPLHIFRLLPLLVACLHVLNFCTRWGENTDKVNNSFSIIVKVVCTTYLHTYNGAQLRFKMSSPDFKE